MPLKHATVSHSIYLLLIIIKSYLNLFLKFRFCFVFLCILTGAGGFETICVTANILIFLLLGIINFKN